MIFLNLSPAWIILIIAVGIVLLGLLGMFLRKYSIGPFRWFSINPDVMAKGNACQYSLLTIHPSKNHDLQGKRVLFLGSSITVGSASLGVSFADGLAKRLRFSMVKEAVSGTTLSNINPESYVARLLSIPESASFDLAIVQLSTNDLWVGCPLGVIEPKERLQYNDKTILGAIETIVTTIQKRYHCPVIFFTNPRFEEAFYQTMIDGLYEISKKHGIGIIDLWHHPTFNQISEKERALYMADGVHPRMAGYLKWWLPEFERQLLDIIQQQSLSRGEITL